MSPAPPAPSRKSPNILALASVTYGAVILVTILSVAAYFYVARGRTGAPENEGARAVTVGSVWIPVYPGSIVEGTTSVRQEGATETTFKFETQDPPIQVLGFYQAALQKGVFRFNTVTRNDGGGTVRSIVHEGKTAVVVTIAKAGLGSRGEVRTTDKDKRN